MHKSDINISLNIDAWRAHSNGLSSPECWKSWSENLQWSTEGKLVTSAIPAMMRRRMSDLSKAAVQTALELLEQHHADYLVFASRHGELHRSVALIDDILKGEEASPMAFSQSVHNTAAGLATIAAKKPIPVTSIAASENTFQSAIIEAWLYLNANPEHKVLVVDFDQPLPEAYKQYETQQYQTYALGLLISSGDDYLITSQATKETSAESRPQGLEFIRHFISNKNQWYLASPQQTWFWQRK